jgi:hypothetical protein
LATSSRSATPSSCRAAGDRPCTDPLVRHTPLPGCSVDPTGCSNSSHHCVRVYTTVWLSCKDRKDWSFETISELMLKDSIDRNVRKLQKLKQKITLLQVPCSCCLRVQPRASGHLTDHSHTQPERSLQQQRRVRGDLLARQPRSRCPSLLPIPGRVHHRQELAGA